MPRYIDAETLMQKLCNQCGVKDREYFCHAHCGDRMNIENIPTADVQPVKHGKWIRSDDQYWLTCPFCDTDVDVSCGAPFFYVDNDEVDHINFCPNCGARMDGDSE